jgi:hypothetical protein
MKALFGRARFTRHLSARIARPTIDEPALPL